MPTNTPSSAFESVGSNNAITTLGAQEGVFYKEGEYWTVGIGGKTVRLKDCKGLAYLAYMLRHPETEFHVLDLAGGSASCNYGDEAARSTRGLARDAELEKTGIHIGGLSDAGEVLDEQAKRAYWQRLLELREELAEAKALSKVARAEQLEAEIEALTGELSRAVGLGGRNRRAASATERARQSVTKAIRVVIERIARSDAVLGDIFSRCIKTGTLCSYQPDPDWLIRWEFAGTSLKPPGQPISSAKVAPAEPDHIQALSVALGFLPFSTARQTPFVDREHESRVIRAAIDHAHNGNGSLVMLTGGLGAGKTRLAVEMAEYAVRNGFAYFLGRCYERDEPFPYLPFAQIVETMLAQAPSLEHFRRQLGDNAPELAQLVPSLRRVFPDIPAPMELPDPQKRQYIFQSITEALARAARTHPHLLILDDLHWADEFTLALLTHLANRIAQLPLVIIGTYRDEYAEHNPVLARTLEELIRQGVRPLKLSGLPKDSVAQMLNELSQRQVPESLVNIIFEKSNGNPFFVEEMYRHLTEEGKLLDSAGRFCTDLKLDEIEVPDNVRLIIARRLRRFNDSEMRVLSTAAVIGRRFSFELLAAVSQTEIDELFIVVEKAQRLGIIALSSERPEQPFTFAHELVRQTLLANMSVVRRQQLHANVAAAIESLYPAAVKEYAGEIADHLFKAGSFAEREAAVHWPIEAGNAALEAAAFNGGACEFRVSVVAGRGTGFAAASRTPVQSGYSESRP